MEAKKNKRYEFNQYFGGARDDLYSVKHCDGKAEHQRQAYGVLRRFVHDMAHEIHDIPGQICGQQDKKEHVADGQKRAKPLSEYLS